MMLLPGTLVDAVTRWRPGAHPGKGGGEDQLQSRVHIHQKKAGGKGLFDAFSLALSRESISMFGFAKPHPYFSLGMCTVFPVGLLLLCMQIKQI